MAPPGRAMPTAVSMEPPADGAVADDDHRVARLDPGDDGGVVAGAQ